jgi:hypothetical protein
MEPNTKLILDELANRLADHTRTDRDADFHQQSTSKDHVEQRLSDPENTALSRSGTSATTVCRDVGGSRCQLRRVAPGDRIRHLRHQDGSTQHREALGPRCDRQFVSSPESHGS